MQDLLDYSIFSTQTVFEKKRNLKKCLTELNNLKTSLSETTNLEHDKTSDNTQNDISHKIHPMDNCVDNLEKYSKINIDINDKTDIITYATKHRLNSVFIKSLSPLEFKIYKHVTQGKDFEFREKATEIINKHFFSTKKKLYKYSALLNNLFNDALDEYIKIKKDILKPQYGNIELEKYVIMIFKGGNLLKSIKDRYAQLQNGYTATKIEEHYSQYFKNSDLDFQLLIHKYITTDDKTNRELYDILKNDLVIIFTLLLNRLKYYFYTKMDDYFDFFIYNKKMQKIILSELLNDLNTCKYIAEQNDKEVRDVFIKNYGEEFKHYMEMKFNNVTSGCVILNEKLSLEYGEFAKDKANILNNFVDSKDNIHILEAQIPFSNRHNFWVDNKEHQKMMNVYKAQFDILEKDKEYKNQFDERSFDIFVQYTNRTHVENVIDGHKYNIDFSLLRMKYNFLASYVTTEKKGGFINIPGELIDISISWYDDFKTSHFKSHTDNITDFYTKYTFDNEEYKIKYNYWSYNIASFIHDLYVILYIDRTVPWNDKKYKKRIYRYMCFSLIEILSLNNADCDTLLNVLFGTLAKNTADFQQETFFNDPIFNDVKYEKLGIIHMIKEHLKLCNYVKTKMHNNYKEFDEYYELFKENVKYYKDIYESIAIYCTSPFGGKINTSDPNFNIINQFGGNYLHKYLKYKNKYLKYKN